MTRSRQKNLTNHKQRVGNNNFSLFLPVKTSHVGSKRPLVPFSFFFLKQALEELNHILFCSAVDRRSENHRKKKNENPLIKPQRSQIILIYYPAGINIGPVQLWEFLEVKHELKLNFKSHLLVKMLKLELFLKSFFFFFFLNFPASGFLFRNTYYFFFTFHAGECCKDKWLGRGRVRRTSAEAIKAQSS